MGWYNEGLKQVSDGSTIDIDADTLKLMLIGTATAYTYDADHDFVDEAGANDPVDAELNGVSGYTRGFGGAGRKTVTITMQSNDTDNRVDMAIADLTWTALGTGDTIDAAILIEEITNDAATRLIAHFDLTNTPTNGGDVTLDFNALGSGGNLRLTVV